MPPNSPPTEELVRDHFYGQPTDAEVIQDLTKRLDASERKCLSKEKLIVKLENRVSNFGTTLQRRDATIRLLLEQIKSY
jgi:uncharacterized coiled-coil protein SlyX